MVCHRYAVIAEVEADGGYIERINGILKEGGRSCVSSVGKVAARWCVYYDAERQVSFSAQV